MCVNFVMDQIEKESEIRLACTLRCFVVKYIQTVTGWNLLHCTPLLRHKRRNIECINWARKLKHAVQTILVRAGTFHIIRHRSDCANVKPIQNEVLRRRHITIAVVQICWSAHKNALQNTTKIEFAVRRIEFLIKTISCVLNVLENKPRVCR